MRAATVALQHTARWRAGHHSTEASTSTACLAKQAPACSTWHWEPLLPWKGLRVCGGSTRWGGAHTLEWGTVSCCSMAQDWRHAQKKGSLLQHGTQLEARAEKKGSLLQHGAQLEARAEEKGSLLGCVECCGGSVALDSSEEATCQPHLGQP